MEEGDGVRGDWRPASARAFMADGDDDNRAAVACAFIGYAVTSSAKPAAARSGSVPVVALQAAATTREQAAQWIAGQVAPSAIVSCDPAMCAALQAAGVSAGRLLSLRSAAADP